MKKLLYIFTLISFIMALNACDDEKFLEQVDEDSLSGENTFTTETQLDNVLVAAYQHSRAIFAQSASYYEYFNGMGTDMYTSAESRPSDGFNDYGTLNSSTYAYELFYKTFYKLLNKANIVIYNADNNDIDWESDESRDYIYAQAYTFRGIAYLNLGELWGGVPLVKDLVTSAKYDYTRSTRIETYEYAIENFEAALDGLPVTTSSGGRIVKGVAQHYLSEAYLALGNALEQAGEDASEAYQKSVDYASDVIDGGTYALMTERYGERADEEDKDVYWDLFRINNVNYQDGNTECIWAYQIDYDNYQSGEDGSSYLNYPRVYSPVLRQLTGMTGTAEDVGGRGVAFMVPTRYTSKYIWTDDEGDIRNSSANIQREFIYNDESEPDYYGKVCTEDSIDNCSVKGYGYPVFYKFTTDEFVGLEDGEVRSNIFRDAYAIRLAETILIRAEAYYRLSKSDEAADDINLIRNRAQCETLATASDIDIDYILDERARELYGEEHRWNTLLRMGGTVFVDRFRAYNAYQDWPYDNTGTLTEDFNLWPIPQSVIDSNYGATIEQNTGW